MKIKSKVLVIVILCILILGITTAIVIGNNIAQLPLAPNPEDFDEEAYRQNQLVQRDIELNEISEKVAENPEKYQKNQEEIEVPDEHKEIIKKQEEENEKVKEIMDRFYPGEIDRIRKNVEKEYTENGPQKNSSIMNSEIEGYELLIDIIKTKSITKEEKEFLKNVLKNELDKMTEDMEIYKKITDIL